MMEIPKTITDNVAQSPDDLHGRPMSPPPDALSSMLEETSTMLDEDFLECSTDACPAAESPVDSPGACRPRRPRSGIDQRIAQHLRELRLERGFSLEELAGRSFVSRAMLSRIECGQSSPTAVVLDRIAIGLGVALPSLFGYVTRGPRPFHPIARRGEQRVWRDPVSGCRHRELTPQGVAVSIRLSELMLPAGSAISTADGAGTRQLWILEGEVVVHAGERTKRLSVGDCMALLPGHPASFRNAGLRTARFLSVVSGPVAGAAVGPGADADADAEAG